MIGSLNKVMPDWEQRKKMNDWKMSYLKISEKSDKGEDLSCNFDMNCAINQMVLEKWLFILKNHK